MVVTENLIGIKMVYYAMLRIKEQKMEVLLLVQGERMKKMTPIS